MENGNQIRKNLRSLTPHEKKIFVEALLKLKKDGRYDEYVHWHHAVMTPTVLSYEPHDPDYRNGAHRGTSFLPWHRAFLSSVEKDLQQINPKITIPYWDWTQDSELEDPKTAIIWSDDFMGGNGVETDQWRVASGPFAYKNGNWNIPVGHDGPALRRNFASTVNSLPTKGDLELTMNEYLYDTPNYNSSPFTIGFRNRLEGWITKRGDYRVATTSSQMHNRVHLWVGGSMEPMTSPNDPVFFLHHCFVDKIWADWQEQKMKDFNNGDAPPPPHYAPLIDGPPGHNLKDIMKPFNVTVDSTFDISALGYSYEKTPEHMVFIKRIEETRRRTRSPFWAD